MQAVCHSTTVLEATGVGNAITLALFPTKVDLRYVEVILIRTSIINTIILAFSFHIVCMRGNLVSCDSSHDTNLIKEKCFKIFDSTNYLYIIFLKYFSFILALINLL